MASDTLAEADIALYNEVTLITFGMFFWDYLITLWLEIHFIEGKLKLRWPLIPYFLARYTALGFVIACLLFQASKLPLNCDALYLGGVLLGKVAVVFASINVLVRTVIIWSYRWYIVLSLGLLVSGEVIVICLGLGDRGLAATWSNDLQACVITPGSHTNLGIFAPYALCVDCVIVTLTIIGLRKFDSKSGFASVLIRQGLGFFLLVLLFQVFVTVGVYDNGNGILTSISSVLCAVISHGILSHGQIYSLRLPQPVCFFVQKFDHGWRALLARRDPAYHTRRTGEFFGMLNGGTPVLTLYKHPWR